MNDICKERIKLIDKILGISSSEELSDILMKKNVVYSREYASVPDMSCPVCGRVLLTNFPRFCSDCGTRLHYKNNEEDS